MHRTVVTYNTDSSRYKEAFTLVELLVVIAILGLLMALLMPSFGKAKNKASQTIDINNLKQLIVATHLYGTDNRDRLPWANWKSGDADGRPGWLYALDTSASSPTMFNFQKGLLRSYLGNRQLYMCPLDNTNNSTFKKRAQQLSSYAINGAIVGFDRTNYPSKCISSMRPDDIAFWETDETQPQYFNDGANFPSEGVSARHNNGAINCTFNGSVSFVRLGTWYRKVYDTNKNALWCFPDSVDGR